MPHDCHNARLEIGDVVIIKAVVMDLPTSEEFHSGKFEVVPIPGCDSIAPTFMCDTRHTEKES